MLHALPLAERERARGDVSGYERLMPRRCEVLTDQRAWVTIATRDLKAGMVYRLFEEDGSAVLDDETDAPGRWRALADAVPQPDGTATVESEAIPESEIERQVRTHGMFWPGQTPLRGPWTPGRLR